MIPPGRTFRFWQHALLLALGLVLAGISPTPAAADTPQDGWGPEEERMFALLQAIPTRWEELPAPRVAYSGRNPEEVLAAATENEKAAAKALFETIVASPEAQRTATLERALAGRQLNEVDLWWGARIVEMRSYSTEGDWFRNASTGFWLAEVNGRHDVLFQMARYFLPRFSASAPLRAWMETLRRWARVPVVPEARKAKAEALLWLGYFALPASDLAAELFEAAKLLFRSIGDLRQAGQAAHWEGNVRFVDARTPEEVDAALARFDEAERLQVDSGDQEGLLRTLQSRLTILSGRQSREVSLAQAVEIRKAAERLGNSTWLRSALVLEATWCLAAGKNEEALQAARRALDLPNFPGQLAPPTLARQLEARALLNLGRPEEALVLARGELVWMLLTRRSHFSLAVRQPHLFWFEANSLYTLFLESLLRLGRTSEAIDAREEGTGRFLLDLIQTQSQVPGALRLAELNHLLALQHERAELGEKLRSAGGESYLELQDRQRWLDGRTETALSPVSLADTSPLQGDELRKLVDQVGPVLSFFVVTEASFAFLLRPGQPPLAAQLPIRGEELEKRVEAAAEALANPNYERKSGDALRELSGLLLGPFEGALPRSGSLVILPHGPLFRLPFEALLRADGSPLFASLDLSYAPSLSVLARLRALHRSPTADDPFAAFAAGRGLQLPRTEIESIARLFNPVNTAELEQGSYFSSYARVAPHARQILFASRGVLEPRNALRSTNFLELRSSAEHDGRLTAAEVASQPLAAELVTLAACDTATGWVAGYGEELDLTQAFLVAGAASVLATRWKVPESPATSRFLRDFYTAYRQGGPAGQGLRKDEALSAARRASQARGEPAQLWAAWVLTGDAR